MSKWISPTYTAFTEQEVLNQVLDTTLRLLKIMPYGQNGASAIAFQSDANGNLRVSAGGVAASASITAATATGAGTTVSLLVAQANFSMQVVYTSVPSLLIVNLEGSLNGTNWQTLVQWSSASQGNGAIMSAIGTPVTYIRANILTLNGGASPTVTVNITAT